jgi:hypothetical protein
MQASISGVHIVRKAVNRFISRGLLRLVFGAGTHTVNVFQLFGGVEILRHQAEFVAIAQLNGLTNVWADATDGTTTITLTASGLDLSAACTGTQFFRGHDETQPFDVILADQIRYYSPAPPIPKLADAYTLNAKDGVDNFARLHFTAGGPLDVTIGMVFVWEPLDGGYIVCCG